VLARTQESHTQQDKDDDERDNVKAAL
jgi:hypothetical protein